MKYLKPYTLFEKVSKLFESLEGTEISIDQLLQQIRMPLDKCDTIINWWNQNRSSIKIYYFPFSSPQPIAGVFLGTDTICVNSRLPMPPHIKLFLALHESRHCDQHKQGILMDGYYNTVVNGNKPEFLKAYVELESDANDFAVASMRQIGFEREMNMEEMILRSNERSGEMVWNMMKSDIEKLKPVDFFDLLKKQVL